ncbi:MAG: hypothetical protein ACHQJ4_03530, partial [Ignavibacteria bacterium]
MQRENQKYYFISFLIFISAAVLLLNGCVDENIAPNEGNVSVQMFDYNLFPGRIGGSTISTGQYPQILPDYSGIAKLTVNTFPYNFKVSYEWYSVESQNIVYDGVTNTTNCIMPFEYFETWEWEDANVLVMYPEIPEGKMALIKFISDETFVDFGWNFGEYEMEEGTSSKDYRVFFPSIKSEISGKILFIEFTYQDVQNYRRILSFDNFGVKPVTLNKNSMTTLMFSEDDIKFNPEECFTYFDVNTPPQIHSYGYRVYFGFDGYNRASNLPIGEYIPGREFITPVSLPVNYKIKVHSTINTLDSIPGPEHEKWFTIDPGSFIILDNSQQPYIISPPDKTNNISDNCSFSYGSGTKNGIYHLTFMCDEYKTQTLVTS